MGKGGKERSHPARGGPWGRAGPAWGGVGVGTWVCTALTPAVQDMAKVSCSAAGRKHIVLRRFSICGNLCILTATLRDKEFVQPGGKWLWVLCLLAAAGHRQGTRTEGLLQHSKPLRGHHQHSHNPTVAAMSENRTRGTLDPLVQLVSHTRQLTQPSHEHTGTELSLSSKASPPCSPLQTNSLCHRGGSLKFLWPSPEPPLCWGRWAGLWGQAEAAPQG